MNELLTCVDLTKQYGSKTALDSINLIIPRGRIIGLLGPNGSGKTTLIKLINGLLSPTFGHLYINGMEPGPETKKVVSYLPERTYFNSWMKVTDILNFFCDFYADFSRVRAEDMLQHLGIDPKVQGHEREGTAYHGHEPGRRPLLSGRTHRRRGSGSPGLYPTDHHFQL